MPALRNVDSEEQRTQHRRMCVNSIKRWRHLRNVEGDDLHHRHWHTDWVACKALPWKSSNYREVLKELNPVVVDKTKSLLNWMKIIFHGIDSYFSSNWLLLSFRNICQTDEFHCSTVWKNEIFTCNQIFSWNQLRLKFLSKTISFAEFLWQFTWNQQKNSNAASLTENFDLTEKVDFSVKGVITKINFREINYIFSYFFGKHGDLMEKLWIFL